MKKKLVHYYAGAALGGALLGTSAIAAPVDPALGGPGGGPGGGAVTVSEPSSWLLMGAGIGVLVVAARRRGKREP